jgi:hypothetical protein
MFSLAFTSLKGSPIVINGMTSSRPEQGPGQEPEPPPVLVPTSDAGIPERWITSAVAKDRCFVQPPFGPEPPSFQTNFGHSAYM